MSEFDFPVGVWRHTLNEAVSATRSMKTGEGSQSTIFGHFNMSLLYGNLVPYCQLCKRDFSPEGDREGDSLLCRGCGAVMAIGQAPQWFKGAVGSAKLVAGVPREEQLPGAVEVGTPTGTGAIGLKCPNCSASLLVDGKERLVPCGYCDTSVYLPDDLWLRLHPVSRKSRWFIGF